MSGESVTIAGGGIGGLAAALFLERHGMRPAVYETASEIRELGVGINLQPHAIRELAALGLLQKVIDAGNPCEHWGLYNEYGQSVYTEPRGTAAGEEWPQVSIHRGALQGILLESVRERLGDANVHVGRRFEHFEQDEDGVRATFAARDGGEAEVRSDILLGADGIHSQVRRQLFPDERPLHFSGQNMWRGVARTTPYLGGRSMAIIGHEAQKFIAYPITGPDEDGLALVNWIVELPAERPLEREDWNSVADVSDLVDRFADWRVPWLDVPALIAETGVAYEFPMVDRDPLPQWSHGRVSLLGDAAHPMYPIGANGASQAIRDGAALGRLLEQQGGPGALLAYDEERRPVTTEIVESNRRLGPEAALQMVHVRAPHGFDHIEDVIPHSEIEAAVHGYRDLTWGSAHPLLTDPTA